MNRTGNQIDRRPLKQTTLAQILSDVDAKVPALETKLSTARDVKAGMMSELLTGRIRLVES